MDMKPGHPLRRVFGALAVVSLGVLAVAAPRTQAQQTDAAKTPLAFEVATIKPSDTSKMFMAELRVYPGGRLVIHAHTLRMLIFEAFDLSPWQISGGEKWVNDLRFDIEGKAPEGLLNPSPLGEFSSSGIQDPRVRSMLQALLIERFHLKSHVESQPGTVYLLKRGDSPLRLERVETNLYTKSADGSVTPGNPYPTGEIGLVSGKNLSLYQTSMIELAHVLAALQRTTVKDQTGLQGWYNFKSQIILTDEDFAGVGPAHLLFDVVPEMGLKLVKTEGTVDKFVIDHVDPPTAN